MFSVYNLARHLLTYVVICSELVTNTLDCKSSPNMTGMRAWESDRQVQHEREETQPQEAHTRSVTTDKCAET